MNPTAGIRWNWREVATVPALCVPAVLAFAVFYLDLHAPHHRMFGLPHLAAILVAHRLAGTSGAIATAVTVAALVAVAPFLVVEQAALAPDSTALVGRGMVIAAMVLVVLLLRQRELARDALRGQVEHIDGALADRSAELRRVNVQLHREIAGRRRAEQRSSYLASIVESSGDAIIGQSLDGLIVSWNDGASKAYGHARGDMVGQPASRLVPEGDREAMTEVLAQVASGMRVEAVESTRLRSDGTTVAVSVSVSPIRDEAGVIVGASLIERDVTRSRKAEEALQGLNAELREQLHRAENDARAAADALDVLRTSVSESLRAPLSDLREAAACLDTRAGGDAAADVRVGHVLDAADRAEQAVRDLVELTRVDLRGLDHEVVRFGDVACRVADDLDRAAPARSVDWVIGDGLLAWGDDGLLRIVLRNLLEHAHRTTESRERARIEVGVESRDGDTVTYFVADNGVGLEMDGERDPFGTAETGGERLLAPGATGLELAGRIVRSHGGSIWAEVAEGRGTLVCFRLPVPRTRVADADDDAEATA